MEKTRQPHPCCPPPPGLPPSCLSLPKPAYLQLPDLLAFLGDLPHRLPHEGDQHVEQEDESEDDVGDQQDDKDPRVLGVLDHLQVPHADGQLEKVQQEGAEGLAVPAGGVGGRRAVGAVPAAGLGTGARVQQGDQRCRSGGEPLAGSLGTFPPGTGGARGPPGRAGARLGRARGLPDA